MKFSYTAIVLGAASVVSAQSAACTAAVAAVPACGAPCIDAAAATYCGANDYACECASATFSQIETDATNCVIAACGATVALQVLSAVNAVCTACA
ncbi:uncharacterized protein EAF01_003633 [Botrytis porri]|uniref:CFEM domain-containing protein n=1 Tax=Botrytis porri TaxID=87229 RepID=A0A4Z1K7L7_9HELO|nr:uncharacterized protein EAF01_003633 [Botrytis porri]KAF7909915.1 hypothetical protein EAF01_003633 [Botrytis porri]TGO81446.1 hypothetical protein BPOR_1150g00020 [Botrytis porri]